MQIRAIRGQKITNIGCTPPFQQYRISLAPYPQNPKTQNQNQKTKKVIPVKTKKLQTKKLKNEITNRLGEFPYIKFPPHDIN